MILKKYKWEDGHYMSMRLTIKLQLSKQCVLGERIDTLTNTIEIQK